MSGVKLPLEGIRVLGITLVWAGPHATQLLADWGAEVIRVEPIQVFQPQTRGDRPRPSKEEVETKQMWAAGYPDWDPGQRPWNRFPAFNNHGRNKLGMTLDLTQPEGCAIFDQLVAISDVLVENNVPETAEKLGLSYERLRRINPTLIMVRMPGFGLNGPYKNFRCLGSHIDAVTGHTWVRGYPDLDLGYRNDVYFSDAAGGIGGALAVMMALRHRRRTGKGQLVELAQVDNFAGYMGEVVMEYRMNGRVQSTMGNRHPAMAPHGCYPCQGEDNWVTIAVGSEEEWHSLCRAMDNPQWAREDRFSDMLGRLKHQDELDEPIGRWTRKRDKHEVMYLLQKEGVAAGAVLTQAEVYTDPHLRERGLFQKVTHPEAGTHLYPAIPAKLSKTPNTIRRPPVLLGEHNEFVYKELLGVTETEYHRLEETGHIGMDYPSHVT